MASSLTIASLHLIALGVLGIILSFLVQDRKKSLLSLVMAIFIVVVGVFQWGSQAFDQFKLNRRMRDIQRQQQVDLEQLREKLKAQAPQPNQSR